MMRHEEARMEYGLSQTWKRRVETSRDTTFVLLETPEEINQILS